MQTHPIARQHSFNAADYCIPRVEDPQVLDKLRANLIAFYRPLDDQEVFAVERLAIARFRLMRVARLEASYAAEMLEVRQYRAHARRSYRGAIKDLKRFQNRG